jgi:ABC-type siderophore export system fused ATPase/permease subunit
MLVVSHDARIVPFVDAVFHLEDGRLSENAAAETDPLSTAGH